ncbi:MAG: hypothetical protein QMD71_06395 [bacterium]|nr:hypothetical protein [bacterium]
MDLKEILEQMKKQEESSKPNMSVTVKVDCKEEVTFTEDFLVLHVGKNHGSVISCVGVVELMQSVEMLIDSVSNVMKRLPPHQQW